MGHLFDRRDRSGSGQGSPPAARRQNGRVEMRRATLSRQKGRQQILSIVSLKRNWHSGMFNSPSQDLRRTQGASMSATSSPMPDDRWRPRGLPCSVAGSASGDKIQLLISSCRPLALMIVSPNKVCMRQILPFNRQNHHSRLDNSEDIFREGGVRKFTQNPLKWGIARSRSPTRARLRIIIAFRPSRQLRRRGPAARTARS